AVPHSRARWRRRRRRWRWRGRPERLSRSGLRSADCGGSAGWPTPRRARRGPLHGGRPRPRHVSAVRIAEAPGKLGSLGDADPLAAYHASARGPRIDPYRPVEQGRVVQVEPDGERLGQLARAGAELIVAGDAPAGSHLLDAV